MLVIQDFFLWLIIVCKCLGFAGCQRRQEELPKLEHLLLEV